MYGVTTEFCVRCAGPGMGKRGYDVTVVSEAVTAVDEAAGKKARDEMARVGIRVADTDTVLGTLAYPHGVGGRL